MTKRVLILGASGKIGVHSARAFKAAGWEVRLFDRKTDDMTKAAQGCDVIVNGMNPPNYHDWATIIPDITAQVLAAARASGATVIVPGNVYVYGDTGGEWSEATPHRPCSRKGHIRAEMEAAYRDSGVPTIILRAGNFIDPDQTGDVLGIMVLNALNKGRINFPNDPDLVQPWAYVPDWAQAAVMLAEKRAQLATFEDVPFPGHAFSLTQLKAMVEGEMGRSLKTGGFPWWVMRLASPVWELARELSEMRYLFDTPHTLSPRKFEQLLPDFRATPWADVVRAALPKGSTPGEDPVAKPLRARSA